MKDRIAKAEYITRGKARDVFRDFLLGKVRLTKKCFLEGLYGLFVLLEMGSVFRRSHAG
jgi:hypothetical protein